VRSIPFLLALFVFACGSLGPTPSATQHDASSSESSGDAEGSDTGSAARDGSTREPADAHGDGPTDAAVSDTAVVFPDVASFADSGCSKTSLCPSVAPSQGSPCQASASCEYGDNPVTSCNTIATCNPHGGGWVLSVPLTGAPCVLSSACPSTFAAAADAGVACSAANQSLECAYPEGACGCNSSGTFTCSQPPAAPCPSKRPSFGTPCSAEQTCTSYTNDTCAGTTQIACSPCAGTWQPHFCPISP
jgi:hypothetical protein